MLGLLGLQKLRVGMIHMQRFDLFVTASSRLTAALVSRHQKAAHGYFSSSVAQ